MIRELFFPQAVAASKSAEKAGEGSMNSYVYKGRQPAKHLSRGKDLQRRANRIATTLTPSQESYYCSLALAAADALVTCLLPASLNWTAPVTRPHKLRHFGYMQSLYEQLDFPLILSQAVIAH